VFTVTQAANTCSYTLTPTNATLNAGEGTGSVTVATASGCAWAATTNQSWITVSGTGTASGSVSYTVQANTTGSNRTGAISIGTQVFTVTQTTTPPVAPGGLRFVGGQ
jgi:Putative binding domain, N-terminal